MTNNGRFKICRCSNDDYKFIYHHRCKRCYSIICTFSQPFRRVEMIPMPWYYHLSCAQAQFLPEQVYQTQDSPAKINILCCAVCGCYIDKSRKYYTDSSLECFCSHKCIDSISNDLHRGGFSLIKPFKFSESPVESTRKSKSRKLDIRRGS